jgi:hypothetical protein|tara:strand:+ start:76 stop:285 length:210 start_codon:yes stop_codon:yes gene_type:complete
MRSGAHYGGSGTLVDWNKVRRVSHGMTEEEKEEVLNRLNEYIRQYSSSETVYFNDDDEGWDYRPEEDSE